MKLKTKTISARIGEDDHKDMETYRKKAGIRNMSIFIKILWDFYKRNGLKQ